MKLNKIEVHILKAVNKYGKLHGWDVDIVLQALQAKGLIEIMASYRVGAKRMTEAMVTEEGRRELALKSLEEL